MIVLTPIAPKDCVLSVHYVYKGVKRAFLLFFSHNAAVGSLFLISVPLIADRTVLIIPTSECITEAVGAEAPWSPGEPPPPPKKKSEIMCST